MHCRIPEEQIRSSRTVGSYGINGTKAELRKAVTPLEKLSDLAQQYLPEFQQSHSKPVVKQPPKQNIWKPPDPSTLKTNFDGAIFEELDATGIGVIVRNSSGELLAALSEIIPLPSSILDWKQLQCEEQSPSCTSLETLF